MILGTGEGVVDLEEKRAALEAIVEHICPGRNAEVRLSNCSVSPTQGWPKEQRSACSRAVSQRADQTS